MASFVHLIDARDAKNVVRNGIRAARNRDGQKVVFCVPVVPDFQTTFQWLRELKRRGYRTAIAAQFRISDGENVLVGRFNEPPAAMTAAEATARFRAPDGARGLEVMVPRAIHPKEITRLRSLPQIVGWRFYPEAKGRWSYWPQPGTLRAKRLRQIINTRYE